MSITLKHWMEAATTEEQEALALAAKTSRGYLYQLATGHRVARADIAGRIEEAAALLRKKSKNRLPKLTRVDLSPTCAACPYAKKCIKIK